MGTTRPDRMARRLVVWFQNDLRLHDNALLQAAVRAVQTKRVDHVLPCYCLDPRHFELTRFGSPKTNMYRARFLLESLVDLKHGLRAIGSDLFVVIGRPEDVIPGLGAGIVLASSESGTEETELADRLSNALEDQAVLERVWTYSMIHRDDLPYDHINQLPNGFSAFRTKVEKHCSPRELIPPPKPGDLPLPSKLPPGMDYEPSLADLPLSGEVAQQYSDLAQAEQQARRDGSMPTFKGGETAALERLDYYLWQSDLLSTYFDSRNGMLGGDYSTKFSAYLALGCLSAPTIASECKRYERQRQSNKSTYWVVFELLWRDYFRFFLEKHGRRVFMLGGACNVHKPWGNDQEALQRWKSGNTGMPLVDANMRELCATGFQSNRGRQNVASYLCLDLELDWRLGADFFESLLIDHDVSSNYGNWNAAAGLTGGRVNKFNITKQSKDYDPAGDYVRTWVPELSQVPLQHLFEPWKMSKDQQQSSGCVIGSDYPAPIKLSKSNAGGKGQGDNRKRNSNQQRDRGRKQKGGNRTSKPSDFELYG